jgi:hypothetical protein
MEAGAPIARYGIVFTIRGGKVVRWCSYPENGDETELDVRKTSHVAGRESIE